MADLIISQPMTFTVDVKTGLVERPQRESLMRGDKYANRIIAELVDGSEPFDITGVTVKGEFCKPPNGDSINLSGEAKGNVAEVQLTDQCYTAGGHYEARVILVLDEVERTVLFISGDVLKSGSGNAAGDEPGGTGSGLPAGGTAGQVLVKVSSAQGDAIWKTLTASDVGALPSGGTAKNSEKLGGKAPEYYLQPRNLLDNSNFQDIDEIINQRGYVSGTNGTSNYCIDRWKLQYNTALQLNSGYVTLTGSYDICQIVSQKLKAGVTYTLAARVRASGGTRTLWLTADDSAGNHIIDDSTQNSGEWVVLSCLITPNADMSDVNVYITNSGDANVHTDIAWAALYEGFYTADNLPPYVPKGYANELLACEVAEKGDIFGMDLLWTNESVNSKFAGQNINVDLSEYDLVFVTFRLDTSRAYQVSVIAEIGESSMCTTEDNNGHMCSRAFNAQKTRVAFYPGYYYSTYAAYTENNGVVIPRRIYGVKGVGK